VYCVQYVRMRNSTLPVSNDPAPAPKPLRSIGRPDTLTAQRVEVGIVLNAMLGPAAATDYLSKHAVNASVMQRVLDPAGRRRGTHDASGIRL
jgi:hypothetical protein